MSQQIWKDACKLDDILPNTGVCAKLNGDHVAIFRVKDEQRDQLYAINNIDPFTNSSVLCRGIVGSQSDRLFVASPIYKQHFCLKTGECLQDANKKVKTYAVRLHAKTVQLSS